MAARVSKVLLTRPLDSSATFKGAHCGWGEEVAGAEPAERRRQELVSVMQENGSADYACLELTAWQMDSEWGLEVYCEM